MMQLVLLLVIGAGLLLCLGILARRNRRAEGGAQAIVEAREALLALQIELLPPTTLGRIFEKQDLEYVTAEAPKDVQDLFLQERQRIAICWVSQIRKQIMSLREFHLGSARFYAGLSLRTELRLAFDFFVLLGLCRTLEIALRWRGPYAAPGMVGRAAMAATRVCDLSERSLEFLKGAEFKPFGRGSVRNPTLP
jgi:hypothetical protein